MSISELLKQAAARLKEAGIDQPRAEAELLLAFVLKKPKEHLIAHPEDSALPSSVRRFRRLIEKRAAREPIAYLTGRKEFYGRPFSVNRNVLIPRPETETLIAAVLDFCHTSNLKPQTPLILDIGTGSGAIGLTLAAELPDSRVVCADVSAAALSAARKNARRLGVSKRVRFAMINILKKGSFAALRMTRGKHPFVLTANLPYLSEAAYRKTSPDIRRHEPKIALVSGRDGLRHYRALMKRLAEWRLSPDLLALEADPPQFAALKKIVRKTLPNHRLEIKKDLAGNARVLLAVIP